MVSFLNHFKWVPVALALIVVVGYSAPRLLPIIEGALTSGSPPQAEVALTPTPAPVNPPAIEVHDCFDTPPLYSSTLAHMAAMTIASHIDAAVVGGFPGLAFYSSYMTSHSSYDDAVSFTINPVPSAPVPPVQQHDPTNPYHDKQLKDQYQQELASYQVAVTRFQQQLAVFRSDAKHQTDRLVRMSFPYDDKGSDLFGCLSYASSHLQPRVGVKTRLLLISSDLINNSPPQELGSLSLKGVNVEVIFFTCSDLTVTCQNRIASVKHLVEAAGAASFTVFDVEQSQTSLPLPF